MSYFYCSKCSGTFDPAFTYCPVCEDVSLIEQLQAKVAELEAEVERLSAAHVKACQANADSQVELAKAEQRVAEACALQVATETRFHWLDAARVAKEIRSGEYRKFVKEV